MKMGKNDPRESMSPSAKGRGYNGAQKGGPLKGEAPDEQCAPGDHEPTNDGPSLGRAGRDLAPDPVADKNSGKGLSDKASVD